MSLKALAAQGRGRDTTVGHLTPGETVVPAEIARNPQVRTALEKAGFNTARYTVGSPQNSINPATGLPEFDYGGGAGGVSDPGGSDYGGGDGGVGNDGGGGGGGWDDTDYDVTDVNDMGNYGPGGRQSDSYNPMGPNTIAKGLTAGFGYGGPVGAIIGGAWGGINQFTDALPSWDDAMAGNWSGANSGTISGSYDNTSSNVGQTSGQPGSNTGPNFGDRNYGGGGEGGNGFGGSFDNWMSRGGFGGEQAPQQQAPANFFDQERFGGGSSPASAIAKGGVEGLLAKAKGYTPGMGTAQGVSPAYNQMYGIGSPYAGPQDVFGGM